MYVVCKKLAPLVSSQTPGCNGQDRVKVRQGQPGKRKLTDAERKADDGPQRLVHFSAAHGESALPESTGPTGKRSARKRACSVWSGGKAAKPYLSLPYTATHGRVCRKLSRVSKCSTVPLRIGQYDPRWRCLTPCAKQRRRSFSIVFNLILKIIFIIIYTEARLWLPRQP